MRYLCDFCWPDFFHCWHLYGLSLQISHLWIHKYILRQAKIKTLKVCIKSYRYFIFTFDDRQSCFRKPIKTWWCVLDIGCSGAYKSVLIFLIQKFGFKDIITCFVYVLEFLSSINRLYSPGYLLSIWEKLYDGFWSIWWNWWKSKIIISNDNNGTWRICCAQFNKTKLAILQKPN